MNDYPKVAIILLTWNNIIEALHCLNLLYELDYPNFEVIIVDNNSQKNPEPILINRFPNIRFFRLENNLGYTGGNNFGLRYAERNGFQYSWLLNCDVIVKFDTLTNLVMNVSSNPKIGLASPIIYDNPMSRQLTHCGTIFNFSRGYEIQVKNLVNSISIQKTPFCTGCLWGTALFINMELIHSVGYLDDMFFAYYEDYDFSIRASKAGFRNVVVPTAVVYHEPKVFKNTPAYYFFYMLRNRVILWKKHGKINLNFLILFCYEVTGLIYYFQQRNQNENSKAVVDAVFYLIKAKHGRWDERSNVPITISRFVNNNLAFWRYTTAILRRILILIHPKKERLIFSPSIIFADRL